MAGQKDRYKLVWHEGRGVWEIRYTDRDENGRPRSRAVSTGVKDPTDKAAAEIFRAEWLVHESALKVTTTDPRVKDLVDAYRQDALARGVGQGTFCALDQVEKWFGARRPSSITARDCLDYARARAVSDGTLRRELGALIASINHGAKLGLVDPGAGAGIALPPPPQGRLLFLDEDQEGQFYALAMGDSVGKSRLTRLTRFVALGLDTGARKGAILGLTWDRVNLGARLIDFRDPGMRTSKKRRATVPINDRLFPVLERAWRERYSDTALVCDGGTFQHVWDKWVGSTPYAWVTPHVMRHTFVTLTLRAGVDVPVVADLVGDRAETILRTYSHVASTWRVQAANARWTKRDEAA